MFKPYKLGLTTKITKPHHSNAAVSKKLCNIN